MTLSITIGGTQATFQIADPDMLDDLEAGDTSTLVAMLSREMNISVQDVEMLLGESSSVIATVDRIRPPSDPSAWTPDPGTSPAEVLPNVSMDWLRDVGQRVEEESRRDRGFIRTPRARQLLHLIVNQGESRGLSATQISKRTGIPTSTIRGAHERIKREKRVTEEFKNRRPGQKLTAEQTGLILERLKDTGGNATEAARQLGLAPRTVQDLRARQARQVTEKVARRTYSTEDKDALIRLVEEGASPTNAARSLGISTRTARGWVRKERLKRSNWPK